LVDKAASFRGFLLIRVWGVWGCMCDLIHVGVWRCGWMVVGVVVCW
jgi:hypothetical protein